MQQADGRSKTNDALGALIYLAVAPGTLAGFIPWGICRWRTTPWFFGYGILRAAGCALIAGGLVLLLDAFGRFLKQGNGAPSPLAEKRCLVVTGSYRFVRNPMYVATVSLVLGQALLFGSAGVLAYGAMGWLLVHLFVVRREEPSLRRQFPAEYAEYCAHVRRWFPRCTPWQGNARWYRVF